jgi:hypothetical protein
MKALTNKGIIQYSGSYIKSRNIYQKPTVETRWNNRFFKIFAGITGCFVGNKKAQIILKMIERMT